MQNITTLKDDDVKLVKFIFRKSIIRFCGPSVNKFKTDLIEVGYIALLEYKQQNNLTYIKCNDDLAHYISNAMHKELKKMKSHESRNVSLNTSSKKSDDLTIGDTLSDNNIYFDSYDCDFIKNHFCQLLNNYDIKDRKILINYFFNKFDNLMNFSKKYNTTFVYVKNLVRDFRQKFKEVLLINDYTLFDFVDETCDEFNSQKRLINYRERLRFKQKGLTLYNCGDLKIYKLIRNDNNQKDCANLLNISLDFLNALLSHKTNNGKLYLYQIQALRKHFYPNYTLNDLTKVEVCVC